MPAKAGIQRGGARKSNSVPLALDARLRGHDRLGEDYFAAFAPPMQAFTIGEVLRIPASSALASRPDSCQTRNASDALSANMRLRARSSSSVPISDTTWSGDSVTGLVNTLRRAVASDSSAFSVADCAT